MNLHKISQELLDRFRDYIADEIGIYFPKNGSDLEKKLAAALPELGFDNPSACIESLLKSHLTRDQIIILARYLTIGETYFFRDPRTFAALKKHIFPEIIKSKQDTEKRIRIWSCACSSGEEPYSIAMLLHELLPDISNWDIQIYGTDISAAGLAKAKDGHYKKWSFRVTPQEIKERYFSKSDEAVLSPEIRKMVKFKFLNLAEDSYPDITQGMAEFDLILCNNILIYFSPKQIGKTIKKLSKALVDNGWLLVTAIEVPYINEPQLKAIAIDNITFFRKTTKHTEIKKHEPEIVKNISQPVKIDLPDDSKKPKVKKQTVEVRDKYEDFLNLYNKQYYPELIAVLENKLSRSQKSLHSIKENENEIILLVKAYGNQRKLDNALAWLQELLKADKLNPFVYCLHATILQEQGQFDEAVQSLKKALYLDPDLVFPHFALGMLSLKQGKKNLMRKHLKNALDLLKDIPPETIIEGTEGQTAAKMNALITSITQQMDQ